MDNMTTNNENKSGISIGLDQLLPEDNKSVQLGLNYGQNECNSQRVLKENNTKWGKGLFGKKGRGSNPFWKKTAKLYCVLSAVCAIVVMVTLYVTHGDFLSYFLYHDTLDAGMDFSIALNMFVDASRMRCLTHCIRPWQICSFMPCFYWCLLRYLITGPMTLRRQLPCAAQKLIYAQHSRAFCYTSFLWCWRFFCWRFCSVT